MKIGSNLGLTIGACSRRQSFTRALSPGLAVSLVGMIALAFPGTAFARETGPAPNVTILIYNYAQVTRAVLAGAEREASRIFGKAGLNVIWLDCSTGHSTTTPRDPCQEETTQATDISLRVLPAPNRNKFQDTVFGFAIRPDLASVYYEYVVRLADAYEFEVDSILGAAIAHEIGHLLLGPNSHYGIGIMRPQWSFEQVRQVMMGTLLFTSEQSKLMQAQARSRMGPQTATLNE